MKQQQQKNWFLIADVERFLCFFVLSWMDDIKSETFALFSPWNSIPSRIGGMIPLNRMYAGYLIHKTLNRLAAIKMCKRNPY